MQNELTVAPGLLIATPQLLDPNFHHSVVLMLEHTEEGSFGLVLNQSAGSRVAELLDGIELEWNGDASTTACCGGPVQPETGWLLHEPISDLVENPGTRQIVPGLYLSSAPQALERVAMDPPDRLIFVLGYSGWGPHQLETELAEGAWVNSDLSPTFIFETPPDLMWHAALQRIGVQPNCLAPAHGVH